MKDSELKPQLKANHRIVNTRKCFKQPWEASGLCELKSAWKTHLSKNQNTGSCCSQLLLCPFKKNRKRILLLINCFLLPLHFLSAEVSL